MFFRFAFYSKKKVVFRWLSFVKKSGNKMSSVNVHLVTTHLNNTFSDTRSKNQHFSKKKGGKNEKKMKKNEKNYQNKRKKMTEITKIKEKNEKSHQNKRKKTDKSSKKGKK